MSDAHAAHAEHHFAHHFDSADAEFEACKQGMWVFLVTEVLMFGGLFVAYGLFRGLYPEMFHAAHKELVVSMGAINTCVLIVSSIAMAWAVSATQKGDKNKAILGLIVTLVLAGCFLVIKYFEWTAKFHHGLLPGGYFDKTNPVAGELYKEYPRAPLFFSLYFVMTGLHGVHVIIGIGLISWLLKRTARGDFSAEYYTPVEIVGFYWHFVDLVWIYLFPLFYLVG